MRVRQVRWSFATTECQRPSIHEYHGAGDAATHGLRLLPARPPKRDSSFIKILSLAAFVTLKAFGADQLVQKGFVSQAGLGGFERKVLVQGGNRLPTAGTGALSHPFRW